MDTSATDRADLADWFQVFARRCQLLAGQLIDTPVDLLLPKVESLLADVPPSLPAREILYVRALTARCLFETMRREQLENHPIVTKSIALWAVGPAAPTSAEWQQCLGRCTGLLRAASGCSDASKES